MRWHAFFLLFFLSAAPAHAQLFFDPPPMTDLRVSGGEPGMVEPLPGAPPMEIMQAGLLWNFRGGMNVAALTCGNYALLHTSQGYATLLRRHGEELTDAHDRLEAWFIAQAGERRLGQRDFDRWNTRVYNGFATLRAKRRFCHVANRIAIDIIYPPEESALFLAQRRMAALREGLIPAGDRQFVVGRHDLAVPKLCPAKKNRLVRCP